MHHFWGSHYRTFSAIMSKIIAVNFANYCTFSAIMSKIIAINFGEFACVLDNIWFWLRLISCICFPKRNILPQASFAKRGRRLLLQYHQEIEIFGVPFSRFYCNNVSDFLFCSRRFFDIIALFCDNGPNYCSQFFTLSHFFSDNGPNYCSQFPKLSHLR